MSTVRDPENRSTKPCVCGGHSRGAKKKRKPLRTGEPVPNLTRGGYKPDSARTWRGSSYRAGGKRVRELRDHETRKDRAS